MSGEGGADTVQVSSNSEGRSPPLVRSALKIWMFIIAVTLAEYNKLPEKISRLQSQQTSLLSILK